MRIRKPIERWFDVPDDPDKARLKIKHLSPGEVSEIFDAAFEQNISYTKNDDGTFEPEFNQKNNKRVDRELTMKKSIVDWENMFDHDDAEMECTEDNIVRAVNEIEGFTVMVNEFRDQLDKDIKGEQEKQRKNSRSSASERKK